MKTFKLALLAAVSATVMTSAAAEGISYNVGVISSYSDDAREAKNFRPAATFGVDYDFGNGFYVGNANVTGKFVKNDAGDLKRTAEMALYAGYANELGNGLRYDVSATRYVFPGAGFSNSNEATVAVGYSFVTVAYTKPFTSSKFEGEHSVDLTLSHQVNDALSADFTITKDQGLSSLDFELAFAYDLGNNLTATASLNRYKPKLVMGLSKSF